jgi:hypothetical protein
MQRYAVLLSGGIDWLNNHPRYLNDLRLAYSVLVDHYGFDKDKVFVAYADGTATDLDGDGQTIFSARRCQPTCKASWSI